MNRKIVVLNLALLALATTLVWQLRARWLSVREHKQSVLSQTPRPQTAPAPLPPPPPKAASPAEYIEVAQKTLFARDRNPNVIVEPPPPPPAPPPPKPMPALPSYYGQMALGKPIVVLSLKGDEQKSYHEGDDVGPFKLISFDRESITFEWEGQTVERKLTELKPKEAPPAQPAAAAAAAPASSAPVIKPIGEPSSSSDTTDPKVGADMAGGFRGCVPNDSSPAGTVVNGYRKVISRSLMGSTCYWEQVK
jgi:hypothetical protein